MSQDQLSENADQLVAVDSIVGPASIGHAVGERRSALQILATQVPFLVIAVEFFLVVLLVRQFQLESQTFARLMQLAFAGFLLHHYLPMRARRPFFAILSVAASVAVVDTVTVLTWLGPGAALIALGLSLIGICHLPVPMAARIALISLVGVVLAVLRANASWLPAWEGMWPVLASMFIFRIMIYLYDLKNRSAPFGPAHAVAYFFMLPNACFPLFPIVDYKTFCTTYYNDDALRIYQTGVKWMLRGIVHLLIYRLVYRYALLNVSDVENAGDVAEFMLATYLLYLRVSGQFHMIVGLLHMFGFNLPETHHLYLLASSFTDFWRRINIYWKDFIMKLFFYPAFFALRSLGTVKGIAVATLVAFFATWALHSWQWFWFRGQFLITWQDISFWCILALLVLVNGLIEAIYGRRRSLTKPSFDGWARVVRGLKTVGTFLVICSLWTLWSCQSLGELQILAESAQRISWQSAAAILGGLAVIGAAGAVWGTSPRENTEGRAIATDDRPTLELWPTAAMIGGAACALLLSTLNYARDSPATSLLAALRHDQLNTGDLDVQRRGYYEELDVVRANQFAWGGADSSAPPGWTSESLFRQRSDFLHHDMEPLKTAPLCGTPASTNRWGMRDRDYEKEKPTNTFRLLLLGSSHEVGSGVKDEETFENLVEDRLNRELASGSIARFECLNMSVGGYSLLQKLAVLEQEGFKFSPDVVIFAICSQDRLFLTEHLARSVTQEREIPFRYVNDLLVEVGVDGRMPPLLIQHRLAPRVPQIYDWFFARLRDVCARRGVRLYVLYRPTTTVDPREAEYRAALLSSCSDAGIELLDLGDAFNEIEDRNSLVLAPWDNHTSALGHRLLADRLWVRLKPRLAPIVVENSTDRR